MDDTGQLVIRREYFRPGLPRTTVTVVGQIGRPLNVELFDQHALAAYGVQNLKQPGSEEALRCYGAPARARVEGKEQALPSLPHEAPNNCNVECPLGMNVGFGYPA